MKFQTIKSPTEITLEGVAVTFDVVDKYLISVTITDAKGNILRVRKNGYSDLAAETIAPPEKVKKQELIYTLPLIGERRETFKEKYEVHARMEELKNEYTVEGASIKEIEEDLPF